MFAPKFAKTCTNSKMVLRDVALSKGRDRTRQGGRAVSRAMRRSGSPAKYDARPPQSCRSVRCRENAKAPPVSGDSRLQGGKGRANHLKQAGRIVRRAAPRGGTVRVRHLKMAPCGCGISERRRAGATPRGGTGAFVPPKREVLRCRTYLVPGRCRSLRGTSKPDKRPVPWADSG